MEQSYRLALSYSKMTVSFIFHLPRSIYHLPSKLRFSPYAVDY